MPDKNKLAKAKEINFRIVECCANCVHRMRRRSWGNELV